MTYAPRGYGKAAIEYVRAHGPQMTGPLAEAIGCDAQSLQALLTGVIDRGLLAKTKVEHMGRMVNQYAIGDGVPIERPKDEPLDPADGPYVPPPPKVRAAPRKSLPAAPLEDHTAVDYPEPDSLPRVATAFETALRKHDLHKPPTCTESQTPAASLAAEPDDDCEFAITSAGRLLIEAGEQRIALSKTQADQLMAYLDRARGVEWETA